MSLTSRTAEPDVGAAPWRIVERFGLVVGIITAWWLCRNAITANIPQGVDTTFHLARSQFGFDQLFTQGRTDGWNPTFAMGAQSFLVYGPGVAMLFAALKIVTFGLLDDASVYAALVALSFISTAPAVSFLVRSLGLGARTGNLTGLLALGISSNYGLGLFGTWYWGLVPHQVALPFVCLSIGAVVRTWRGPQRRWVVLGGSSLAMLAVTHLQSAMATAMFLVMLTPGLLAERATAGESAPETSRLRAEFPRDAVKRIGALGGLALGLAAFWWIPFIALNSPRGLVATWPTPSWGDRVSEVLDGRELFRPTLALAVTIGVFAHLWRVSRWRTQPLAITLAAGPLVIWALLHWFYTRDPAGDLNRLLANRTLPYLGIFLLIPLAYGLAAISDRVPPWGDLLAIATAVLLVVLPLRGLRQLAVPQQPTPEANLAADALTRLVPEHRRFLFVHDEVPRELSLGVGHPGVWLAQQSGRPTANGYGSETVTRFYTNITHEFLDLPPDTAATWLTRMRVTHVVTISERAREKVEDLPGTENVWEAGVVTIFAVSDPAGFPQPASLLIADGPMDATLDDIDEDSLRWTYRIDEPTNVTIGIAWFEKWELLANGQITEPQLIDGLIRVRLDPAPATATASSGTGTDDTAGTGTLELRYRDAPVDYLGRVVSVLTFAGLTGWIVRNRARRQRPDPPQIDHDLFDADIT